MKNMTRAQRPNAQSAPKSAANHIDETIQLEGAFGTLSGYLQQGLHAQGYKTPTPIQEQCIPHLLEGRDLIGSAQTGTGKTAAFTLPLLQQLATNTKKVRRGTPRALILAPTRELAAQIGDSIRDYGRFLRLRHTTIFGGVNQVRQVRDLNRGVDILVATPGRLLDLMQQGHIHLGEVEHFILDEVDRMLDMGFIPDIERVLASIPSERQTLFFSATMAPKVAQLARTMVKDPVYVSITPDEPAVERIAQKVLFVDKRHKDDLLISLLKESNVGKVIVFTQMKHAANRVVEKLQSAGIQGTAIHGNKSQAARTRALEGFKGRRFQVLVATDVAARGLDVDDISHVINYDLPIEAETYVHRIGRTGRAGAEGDAISFCTADDRGCLRQIERLLGKPVDKDLEHQYHCESAARSKTPVPRNFGRREQPRNQRSGRPNGPGRRPAGSSTHRVHQSGGPKPAGSPSRRPDRRVG